MRVAAGEGLEPFSIAVTTSTAFWDAFLRGDAAARTWLDGDGPHTVLDTADRWQRK